MRPLLGQVGRCEVYRDFLGRERKSGGMQRRLYPLPAFGNGLVWQTDDIDADPARRHHHLHFNRHALDTLKSNRTNSCNHGPPPQTSYINEALCPVQQPTAGSLPQRTQ